MPQPYSNGELVIVIDCSDLDVSARFWCGVLGYTAGPPAAGTVEAGTVEAGTVEAGTFWPIPTETSSACSSRRVCHRHERATEPHHRLVP